MLEVEHDTGRPRCKCRSAVAGHSAVVEEVEGRFRSLSVAGVFDRANMDAAAPLLRGEGLTSEMKSKLLGLGLGLTLSTLGVAAVPATAAFADTTCYTGCTTAVTSPPQVTPTVVTTPPAAEPAPASTPVSGGALPFTGADIEEMAAVGAGALLVGGLMVRRSRRVRRAAA